jgi:hypothetical protein
MQQLCTEEICSKSTLEILCFSCFSKDKKGWGRRGSYQAQGPEIKLHYHKKKKFTAYMLDGHDGLCL